MTTRLLTVSMVLLAGAAYVAHVTKAELVPPRASFADFPRVFGGWEGRDDEPFAPNVLRELGVDAYLNRVYVKRGEGYVALYVGFYESQRQGDTMHSPLNCLPGAGWEPVRKERRTFDVHTSPGAVQPITVNQFVIQKGLDRQLVLYWYQSHGRVIASEYSSKLFMVYDAMRLNRTDGAMVRVITPLTDSNASQDAAAVQRATVFVQEIFPVLGRFLPV